MQLSKETMFQLGAINIAKFCCDFNLKRPGIYTTELPSTCGLYVSATKEIKIDLKKCALIGYSGMFWSYPGYVIDRTPYGVILHEFGHHIYISVPGNINLARIFIDINEKPITGYAPNPGEVFAEMFRLFLSNPDLLAKLRPHSFGLFQKNFPNSNIQPWKEVIKDAPPRTIAMAEKKIKEAAKHFH